MSAIWKFTIIFFLFVFACKEIFAEQSVDIIVKFKDQNTTKNMQKGRKNRKVFIKTLKKNNDIATKYFKNFIKGEKAENIVNLWAINSYALKVKPSIIEKIKKLPQVESVRYDQTLQLPDYQEVTQTAAETNLNLINAPAMWQLGYTGHNIVIAIMDSGVDIHHPDIAGSWLGGSSSWFDPYNHTSVPYDFDGHGTQVAGILTGSSGIGGSPDSKWICAKIFNDSGQAPYSKIHECFQFLLDPDLDPNTDDSPDIVNNSWGLLNSVNQCITEFYEDIELLKALDIIVIFSAGNDGPSQFTSISPANYDNVLSVGAVNNNKIIANFSSRGPSACTQNIFPSIVAPGVNIKTSDLTGGGTFPQSYAYVAGTSFAAPHVSAACALLKNAFPDSNATIIEDALLYSAQDLGVLDADYSYGNGFIDVIAAYQFLHNKFCTADLNTDGVVSLADLYVMSSQWLTENCLQCQSDLNNDQKVNLQDFAIFSRQFTFPECR